MLDVSACLYVSCSSENKCDRLRYYLEPETRPDFPEDVPADEAALVELFEEMPDPEEMNRVAECELIVYFGEDAFSAKELLPKVLPRFQVKQALWYEDSTEHQEYYRFEDDSFEFLYSPEPLESPEDDERYNRELSQAVQDDLHEARKKGIDQALLCLGRALREPGD